MNRFDLVVPGLCGPLPDVASLQQNPTMHSLARWLGRATRSALPCNGFHAQLASLFGLDSTTAMPSAVLSLLGHGHSPGNGYWMHADPVHLQAELDHAILRDSQSLDISPHEADALLEEVNRHFSDDHIRLVAIDAGNWFFNSSSLKDVVTTPLHDVIGRNVNFFLPAGEDEKYLKRFMNEVQMLFHMSVVNQRREQSGLLPVNSLWLWGGGEKPVAGNTDIKKIYSNHALVKGLAVLHNIGYASVSDINTLIDTVSDRASSLIVLDDLFNISSYGDIPAWQEKLDRFYTDLLEPVLSCAMKQRRPVYLYPCNGVRYIISPSDRYRLFRRLNIADHISTYE